VSVVTSPDKPFHLFNGFRTPYGGSEQEALALYRQLREHQNVELWASSSRACPSLMKQEGIRHIAPHRRQSPNGGTYIFVGAHWRNKLWPYLIPRPSRLIHIYNTLHPKHLELTTRMPRGLRWPKAEFVVISDFQKRLLGIEAEVHPSPIDLERFQPATHRPPGPLRIGRMSRDNPDKHHEADLSLYGRLAQQGVEVHLQGATCLAGLPTHLRLKVTPVGAMEASRFLQQLDILYYRTGRDVETFGRVVFEAMASGLPVVCHRHGGYADWIEHGKNGLLFDNTEEAERLLQWLIHDSQARQRLGEKARQSVEAIYSPADRDRRQAFYLK
jgi:glycosyltransferase involved in cell wall biosynthesis